MSQHSNTKNITLNVKDLSFKKEKYVLDLIRYLAEALPQIRINREGNEIDIVAPIEMSKRIIRLRIKKYLHKKGLTGDFRPISLKNNIDKDGYTIKERKYVEFTYY